MDFSFGIITNGNGYIESIIESINRLNIPNYEILVVGTYSSNDNRVRVIDSNTPFIGIKKNMVTENAIYENVVYLHDYISFSPDWYNGFLNFGNDFDVCMNKIVNVDGSRYRDWCLWSDDSYNFVTPLNYLLPYDISHLSKMMYISGAYWVSKKSFMLDNPINTTLKWGQGEDVEWSLRVREKTEFKMNIHSTVNLLKYKDKIFNCTTDDEADVLRSIKTYDTSNSYKNLLQNHIGKWIN
jgi:hypothetical protein